MGHLSRMKPFGDVLAQCSLLMIILAQFRMYFYGNNLVRINDFSMNFWLLNQFCSPWIEMRSLVNTGMMNKGVVYTIVFWYRRYLKRGRLHISLP